MSDIEVVSYTRCHSCQAWDPGRTSRAEATDGYCRRHAPRPVMCGMMPSVAAGGMEGEIVVAWPRTDRDDGCAEAL